MDLARRALVPLMLLFVFIGWGYCQDSQAGGEIAIVGYGMDNGTAGPYDYHYNTVREFIGIMQKSGQNIRHSVFMGENASLQDLFAKIGELKNPNGTLILFISGHGNPGGIENQKYSQIASRIRESYQGKVFIYSSFCYSYGLAKEADGISSTNGYKSVSSWGDTSFPIALFNVFERACEIRSKQRSNLGSFRSIQGRRRPDDRVEHKVPDQEFGHACAEQHRCDGALQVLRTTPRAKPKRTTLASWSAQSLDSSMTAGRREALAIEALRRLGRWSIEERRGKRRTKTRSEGFGHTANLQHKRKRPPHP